MRKLSFIVMLLLVSPTAWAHAPIAGLNSFLNGALHPLLIPAHVMILLGLGLLVGRQGSDSIGKTLPVFMLVAIPGVVLSLWFAGGDTVSLILLGLAALLGLLVAAGWPLPPWGMAALAVVAAVLVGIDSGQESFSGRDHYTALGGAVVGASLLLIYAAGFTEYLRKLWQGIPLRVMGSWLAASALMVLALNLDK